MINNESSNTNKGTIKWVFGIILICYLLMLCAVFYFNVFHINGVSSHEAITTSLLGTVNITMITIPLIIMLYSYILTSNNNDKVKEVMNKFDSTSGKIDKKFNDVISKMMLEKSNLDENIKKAVEKIEAKEKEINRRIYIDIEEKLNENFKNNFNELKQSYKDLLDDFEKVKKDSANLKNDIKQLREEITENRKN